MNPAESLPAIAIRRRRQAGVQWPGRPRWLPALAILASLPACTAASFAPSAPAGFEKIEARVAMRDGVKLYTAVYVPRDRSRSYPMLMKRTPYSCAPYGAGKFPETLGPHEAYEQEGYIFVEQDVRGCFMSEGEFENMRPHLAVKRSATDIDESTDTHDTIDWLLANVPNHNGRLGLWGISYPGFYAAAGMIDAHPALAAVSPQAPIADWYFDDFHHHGALFLPHTFGFFASFGRKREGLHTDWGPRFNYGTPDGYQFYMDLGPLSNVNRRYLHGEVEFWNRIAEHPDYDEFWQARNILPHLNRAAPAILTVGGWFDAEDLYGPLKIYREIERRNPDVTNTLVMGPWNHGGWSRTRGDRLGNIHFGSATSDYYREQVEMPFFRQYLKGEGDAHLPEALMFETGANRWRRFDCWPPEHLEEHRLFMRAEESLSFKAPAEEEGAFDEYVSDPARPVPYTEAISIRMTKEYMVDDQRFAARRPDVLVYQTEELESELTVAGPLVADLWVSTSGGDADFVVKLIDVFPPDAEDPPPSPTPAGGRRPAQYRPMGGYQMMVRSEVFRGRYRNGYDKPEPFEPNVPARVRFELQDVLHTFRPGHRVMVQIQSTWFPLVDRNPQGWTDNIFHAEESDFVPANIRVFRSALRPSCISFGALPGHDRSAAAAERAVRGPGRNRGGV